MTTELRGGDEDDDDDEETGIQQKYVKIHDEFHISLHTKAAITATMSSNYSNKFYLHSQMVLLLIGLSIFMQWWNSSIAKRAMDRT